MSLIMKSSTTTVFNSFSSSFYFFFFLFSSIFVSWSTLLLSSNHRVVVAFSLLNSEGEALLSLLNNHFSLEYSDKKLDWNNLSSSNTSSPCDWVGIGCNTQNTHVVSLNLSGYYISGQLGPQIGRLSYLKSLDLSWNRFNGSIPVELWNCSRLQHLDLFGNLFVNGGFSGQQLHIGRLRYLQYLDLSYNSFNGSIPIELWNCSRLQHLGLSLNGFSGELPTTTVSNLQQLIYFSVSRNHLIGRIPENLFEISGLEYVNLGSNIFNTSIPFNIGNATNMKTLLLDSQSSDYASSNNQLYGSIPSSITNCTKLEVLHLSNTGGLSGEIPLGLWRIPTLALLFVSGNNLSGELPVEMTTELHHLSYIDLSNNQFSGLIPEALGINSTSLWWVDFRNNSFSGEIPPNLCFGKLLEYMMLDQNQFHGNIPASYTGNCDSLTTLTLGGNQLNGSFPHFGKNSIVDILDISKNNLHGRIPSSICNLTSLWSLDLSENQMGGALPHCLGNLKELGTLNLRSNNFSGTIPPNFTTDKLCILDLNGNHFDGKIPRIHSSILRYLDLGNNQLNDTFPFFLQEISSNLRILVLRSNKLYGPLRHGRTRLPFNKLKILDISSNYFTGDLLLEFVLGLETMKHKDYVDDVPSPISQYYYQGSMTVVMHKGKEMGLNSTLMTNFRAIDMSNNRFQGTISKSIGELLWLTMLNLSNNNLTGCIPSSMGNLTQLESLDLSKNKLVGEIPWQLTNLNFLAALNLSHNSLTGLVPNGKQFQTFLNDSFDGNPELCGYPLSRRCDHQTQIQEKEDNPWSFGWEPVAIGYGCGVLIGLVLQYFVFTKAFLYRWFG